MASKRDAIPFAFRLLAHVPNGDRDKHDSDNSGKVADPFRYRIPHSEPSCVCRTICTAGAKINLAPREIELGAAPP